QGLLTPAANPVVVGAPYRAQMGHGRTGVQMRLDVLQSYYAGDQRLELQALVELRRAGEAAARRLGLQPVDVDAAGVDFAAVMRSEERVRRCGRASNVARFLQRAATWFAAKQRRGAWSERVVLLHEVSSDPHTGAAGSDLTAQVARRQCLCQVRECVRRLSADNQQLYGICVVEGRDCAEVAARLGCSPAAARRRLERLRGRLRRVVASV